MSTAYIKRWSVTTVHVFVFSSKVPPLKAIHWAQVSFLTISKAIFIQKIPGAISIPDSHTLFWQLFSICWTLVGRIKIEFIKCKMNKNKEKDIYRNKIQKFGKFFYCTLINHSSSCNMPFQKTLLVVSKGNWSARRFLNYSLVTFQQ